MLEWKKVSKK